MEDVGTVIDVQVFTREGIKRDSRAQSIIDAEIDSYNKDLSDRWRIVESDLYSRLEKLLIGKIVTGGPKQISKIKIENKKFSKNIKAFEIDLFCRNYLSRFGIFYGHGTGHGVGNFGDVHEKYPIISSRSKDTLTNNNLFSIEPGHYVEGQFGLRLENLYVTKILNRGMKLKNITLVPYDLELVDLRLITNIERKFIKKYHQNIYKFLESRLSNKHKKYFIKNLINKI